MRLTPQEHGRLLIQAAAIPVEHRERAIGHLQRRGLGLHAGRATQQQRRLARNGGWKARSAPHADTSTRTSDRGAPLSRLPSRSWPARSSGCSFTHYRLDPIGRPSGRIS